MARKVLIVEDESNIAELINLYLKKEGYETMVAGDGGKALELYRLFRPDLVLLDIMLPVMDGWAVCAKIRETDKTPIIMLTAKGETIDKVAGLEMGADDYIVKPFEMKELLARVHAVLRRLGGDGLRQFWINTRHGSSNLPNITRVFPIHRQATRSPTCQGRRWMVCSVTM